MRRIAVACSQLPIIAIIETVKTVETSFDNVDSTFYSRFRLIMSHALVMIPFILLSPKSP